MIQLHKTVDDLNKINALTTFLQWSSISTGPEIYDGMMDALESSPQELALQVFWSKHKISLDGHMDQYDTSKKKVARLLKENYEASTRACKLAIKKILCQ